MYGVSLFEKTVGLVGYGRIGSRVAARAKGFSCRVIVYDPFIDASVAEKDGIELASLDEVLAESDFLSLHLPANDETRGFFNTARFAQMKSTAILVNTARGEVVDQESLLAALRDGQIGGAGEIGRASCRERV